MPDPDLIYRLALSCIPGIGPVHAKKLLDRFGEAKAIFQARSSALAGIKGIGEARIHAIRHFDQFGMLEKEMAFIERYAIRCLFYTEKEYPQRLLRCKDAPVLLYFKGKADLNAPRIIAIVGTRTPTQYGKQAVEGLVRELAGCGPLIISGLAHGVDTAAHRAALDHSLLTVAILGHGLDVIYPPENKPLAADMLKQGGLITNFHSHQETAAHNFPIRNRIVAGLCDALIVIETDRDGGSMLTARNALAYKRKVFALPGRITDKKSRGCNQLIQEGCAKMLLHPSQIKTELGWEKANGHDAEQRALFPPSCEEHLNDREKMTLLLLRKQPEFSIDELACQVKLSASILAMTLFNLEMKGLILSLPGKLYRAAH